MSAGLLLPAVHASLDTLLEQTIDFDTRDPDAPAHTVLTNRELDILEALAHLRYLTTMMLAALCWGPYNSQLRHRMHTLFHAGLVRRFRPPIIRRRAGGAPWVYELDSIGYRLLRDQRPETTPPWTQTELHSFTYAEHDLELNALLCELAARAATNAGTSGPLWHAAPFQILGPRAGRIDPEHDARPPDAHSANQLPDGHIIRPATSRPGVLEPDATLTGQHHATGEPIAILIEYDRTRRASKLTSKLARYDHFLTDGWRHTRYARQPDEPAVLFITATDTHLPNAINEADRQLTAAIAPAGRPDQARYPGREELAFTTRQRLLAGDETLTQVIAQPANAGPTHTTHVILALTRLFGAPPRPGAA
jgi:hypothetical protein